MASNNTFSSPNRWTTKKNKLFENALAIYDKETPDSWYNIALFVGGTSEVEVKRQYEILLKDIENIEAGKVPLPAAYRNRRNAGCTRVLNISNAEQRLRDMKMK